MRRALPLVPVYETHTTYSTLDFSRMVRGLIAGAATISRRRRVKMTNYPEFGALLNQFLTEQDRTSAWLARRLGMHGGTVGRWLNDGARPGNPEMVVRIADVLGVSAQRGKLLLAAGYGYVESSQETSIHLTDAGIVARDAQNAPASTPLPPPSPKDQGQILLPQDGHAYQPKSSLVGRQNELQLLQHHWENVQQGRPHFVCVEGEAGIGKSSLVQTWLDKVQQHGFATAYARAYAAEGHLAYDPIATWLRSPALEERRQGLADIWLIEIVRLVPELLVANPDLPQLPPMTERWQQRRFFEALAQAFLSQPAPLLLVLDDLQWCDHETMEWLHFLLRFSPSTPLLIVGTIRAGEVSPDHPFQPLRRELMRDGLLEELALRPFDRAETAQFVHRLTGRALDADRQAMIHHLTAGNPLFIEEMVRAGIHNDALLSIASVPTPLPAKLQAVIEARLAYLSPAAYALAGLLAAVARPCTLELLRHASDEGEETLLVAMEELWQRRMVCAIDQRRYDFSHDLIREATYRDLSPARRSFLHRRLAETMAQLEAANPDAASSQIADHFERAGLPLQALPYYERAAATARWVFAHVDAIRYLNCALLMLESMEDDEACLRRELDLQLALSLAWTALKGNAAPELLQALDRAEVLSQQVGDDLQRLIVLNKKALALLIRDRVVEAYTVSQQRMPLVQRLGDHYYRVETTLLLGVLNTFLGQFRPSQAIFEQMLEQTDFTWSPTKTILDLHPIVTARRFLAIVLWHLGFADAARQMMDEAISSGQAINHPFTQAGGLAFSASLALHCGDAKLAQAHAEASQDLATQWGFDYWVSRSKFLVGNALALQGQVAQGLAMMRTEIGNLHVHPNSESLLQLATVYWQAGQAEKGLPLLQQAQAMIAGGGSRICLAEVHHIRGCLLQHTSADAAFVEAAYLEALAIAREQEAKSLEVRAAMSLCLLWAEQGQRREAHALLSGIYDWFTEGFETRDLQDARELLAQLA